MENTIDIRVEIIDFIADSEMVLAFKGKIKEGDPLVKYKCFHNDEFLKAYISEKKQMGVYELDWIDHLKNECVKLIQSKSTKP